MIDFLDIAIRTSISYVLLLLLTRIMGRKQISQLTFFDFVSGISLGSIAASTLINPNLPLLTGVVALIIWTGWVLATARLTLVSLPARKIIEAEPLMVIHKGKILEEKLVNKHYNVNDLLKQLREKSVFDPSEVEVGIIETDGQISILKKSQFQPLTRSDMNLADQPAANSFMIGKELIIDGKIIEENLKQAGMEESYLLNYLHLNGVTNITDVVLAGVNPQGQIYFDIRKDTEDNLPPNQM